jgi:Capsule polysaccharide biosynthesis protein
MMTSGTAGDFALAPKRFAYTHPRHLQELYELAGGCNLYGRAVRNARDLKELARKNGPPELLIVGNLLESSPQLADFCSENGVDRVYGEFGWFPHYTTVHADPLGYAWESSLCRTKFRGLTANQRATVTAFREDYLSTSNSALPQGVHKPFVFWPLQLIIDRVNKHDLNLPDWFEVLLWTRQIIPAAYQLVIKHHPIQNALSRRYLYTCLPNTLLLDPSAPLRPLIEDSSGVIGCNSTVLLESRLLFRKPTWAYGRSWYTGHPDLIFPLRLSERPSKLELLGQGITEEWSLDYGDWFLWELLARQYPAERARNNPAAFLSWIHRRFYKFYLRVGEDAFEDMESE